MEPELQAAHPEIRTYAGAAADGSSIRLDVTPMGFHAIGASPRRRRLVRRPAPTTGGRVPGPQLPGGAVRRRPEPFVEKQVQRAGAAVAAAADESFSTPGGVVTQRDLPAGVPHRPHLCDVLRRGRHTSSDPRSAARSRSSTGSTRSTTTTWPSSSCWSPAPTPSSTCDTAAEMTGANGPCGASACYTADPGWPAAPATPSTATSSRSARSSAPTTTTSATSASASTAAASPGSAWSAAPARPAAAPASRHPTATSTRSTTWPTRWATRWVATTPSTAPRATAAAATATRATSVEPGSGTSVMAYAGICGARQPAAAHATRTSPCGASTRSRRPRRRRARPTHEVQVGRFTGLDNGEQITITLRCPALRRRPT